MSEKKSASGKAPALPVRRPVPDQTTSTSASAPQSAPAQASQAISVPSDEPPVYSALPNPAPSLPAISPIPGLPSVDFTKYAIPDSEISKDQTTITTYNPALSSQPSALVRFIREQATLPPKLTVCIRGTHTRYGQPTTDFIVYVNLMGLLWRQEGPQWSYVKVIEEGENGWRGGSSESNAPNCGRLEEWAEKFVRDRGNLKTFQLERKVVNWDTEAIEGRIRSLMASLNYRGHVDIFFPMTHSKVIVHASSSIGGIFSLFVAQKRYEVVKAVWPYARSPHQEARGDEAGQYAVMSEQAWWNDWKDAIARAIMQQRQGWVSTEDRLQALMSPIKPGAKKHSDWGMDT